LDWIANHGGMALLNAHPDYMDFDVTNRDWRRYPVRFYAEFLEYIVQHHADTYWACCPKELTEWYLSVVRPSLAKLPAAS